MNIMKLQGIIKEKTQKCEESLINLFKEKNEDYALFSAVIGDKFPTEDKNGIMFYGRATNGWDEKVHDTSCILNYMKSSFFRLMRNVYSHYYHNESNPDYWINFVAYSNVAKIAPEDAGNPNEQWWDLQYKDIVEILKIELEEAKPKVAIFVTGNTAGDTWHAPLFNDGGIYQDKFENNKKEDCECGSFTTRNDVEKKCTATAYLIDGTLVIITDRPEFRNMESHVEKILYLINKYAKDL